ncbi:NAD-binding protein [Massilia eurypsychrophila]|nr:NAD-binding protein [Massilia eurypsychrophila]
MALRDHSVSTTKPAEVHGRAVEGVYYRVSPLETKLCRGDEAIVVGGGNSAGQAAVFLASHAARVHMAVRGDGLADSMSNYLSTALARRPPIVVHAHTEITELEADEHGVARVHSVNRGGGID